MLCFLFLLCSVKPPDDPSQRKSYFKMRQQYPSFLRLYGDSLVGGIDQAKIITVTETEDKEKTGKNKQGKTVSFDKGAFINTNFPKYLELPFTIYV